MERWELLKQIAELDIEAARFFNQYSYIEIIKKIKDVGIMYTVLKELFNTCFKNDIFDSIETDEEYDFYRDLIRRMNGVSYEPVNKNPEIEKYNQYKRKIAENNSSNIDFADMYATAMLFRNDIDNLSLYKFYYLFHAIKNFKLFDITAINKIVNGSEEKVNSWCEHITLTPEDKREKITLKQLEEYM